MTTKKLLCLGTALLLGIFLSAGTVFAQTVAGDGNIQTQSRETGNFKEISSSGIFHLVLTQGNTTAVKVRADANILPYIITEVDGNRLKLKTKRGVNIKPTKSIMVYITVNKLDDITVSGTGTVESTNTLQQDHLGVTISGSSEINLDLQVSKLSASVSGTGKGTLKGKCTQSDYRISGTANIDAGKLVADDSKIAISGVGKLHVNAQKQLDISISGMGKVWYQGNPRISQAVSGMGKVMHE